MRRKVVSCLPNQLVYTDISTLKMLYKLFLTPREKYLGKLKDAARCCQLSDENII